MEEFSQKYTWSTRQLLEAEHASFRIQWVSLAPAEIDIGDEGTEHSMQSLRLEDDTLHRGPKSELCT